MSLEENQRQHLQTQAMFKNSSSSNDPEQMKADLNEMLIRGAGIMGNARELGLSDEMAVDIFSEQARRNQMKTLRGQ